MAQRIGTVTIVTTNLAEGTLGYGETETITVDLIDVGDPNDAFPKVTVRDEAGEEFYLLTEKGTAEQ